MNQAAPELLPEDYKEALDIVRQCIEKYGYFKLEPDAKYGTRVLDSLIRAAQPNPNMAELEAENKRLRKGIELLPCPFCGALAEIHHDQSSDYSQHWAYCVQCTNRETCWIQGFTSKDVNCAIKHWNTRASIPRPKSTVMTAEQFANGLILDYDIQNLSYPDGKKDLICEIEQRDAAIEARVRAEFVHIGWQYQDDEGHWRNDSFYNGHRAGVSRKAYAAANPGDAK